MSVSLFFSLPLSLALSFSLSLPLTTLQWGAFARSLLGQQRALQGGDEGDEGGEQSQPMGSGYGHPRDGGHDDGAHPPIHPTKHVELNTV